MLALFGVKCRLLRCGGTDAGGIDVEVEQLRYETPASFR